MKEVKKKEAAPMPKPKVATGKMFYFFLFFFRCVSLKKWSRNWPGSASEVFNLQNVSLLLAFALYSVH